MTTAKPATEATDAENWVALSASERACYHWPDDTDAHKALRAAYVSGAVESLTAKPATEATDERKDSGTMTSGASGTVTTGDPRFERAAPKRCKFCESGHQPNGLGEHWIVKSIIPARITIKKCARGATATGAAT